MSQPTASPSLDASGETLDALIDPSVSDYAGNVTPTQCYEYLKQSDDATLVDVRTQPEWQFVGVPDLRAIEHELQLISWKHYPTMSNNEQFTQQLSDAVPDKDAPVFFLCRSGARSLDAAICATALGYKHCFNVEGGFEGGMDTSSRRGNKDGWKAVSLPWYQT